jgi:hypothetical protein
MCDSEERRVVGVVEVVFGVWVVIIENEAEVEIAEIEIESVTE